MTVSQTIIPIREQPSTMPSQQHLKILNLSPTGRYRAVEYFHIFSKLSKELRLKIWRTSLQRERIIEVSVEALPEVIAAYTQRYNAMYGVTEEARWPSEELASTSTVGGPCNSQFAESKQRSSLEEQNQSNQGAQYRALVRGKGVLSKLLRVNREAREEALKFYRVHIPCGFTAIDPGSSEAEMTAIEGTLLLNPEYDFLHIKPQNALYQTALAALMIHIKTCLDPRRIGLLNLALDIQCLSNWGVRRDMPQPWDNSNLLERRAFVEAIEGLQEAFFITRPRVGRQIIPWVSGIDTTEVIFNRSIPIYAHTPAFVRFPRDPRPIEEDLRKVFSHDTHPPTALRPWHALLEDLGVAMCQARYSWLLSFEPGLRYGGDIYSKKDAETFIQREDDAWHGRSSGPSISDNIDRNIACGRASPDIRTKNLDQAAQPAFGFWLFPLTSGGLDEKGMAVEGAEATGEAERWASTRVRDLSAYRPGLLVADLL